MISTLFAPRKRKPEDNWYIARGILRRGCLVRVTDVMLNNDERICRCTCYTVTRIPSSPLVRSIAALSAKPTVGNCKTPALELPPDIMCLHEGTRIYGYAIVRSRAYRRCQIKSKEHICLSAVGRRVLWWWLSGFEADRLKMRVINEPRPSYIKTLLYS